MILHLLLVKFLIFFFKLGRQNDRGGEEDIEEIFNPLAYCSNVCKSHSWAWQKPGTRNSTWASQILEQAFAASQESKHEDGLCSEAEVEPRLSA